MRVDEEVKIEELNINESTQEPEEEKQKKGVSRIVLLAIIAVLLFIIIILCFRIGKIGYNYLSIWNTKDVAPIVIKNGDLQITTNTGLDIFGNLIAPMSKGATNFTIRNDTNEDVIYHFRFVDEMNAFVNMKYRLKIDNIYVRGNKDEYIDIKDLDVENVIIPKDSTSIYTLEWFWESDDEKDTYVGTLKDDQHYTLNLYIFSQAYKKGGNNN